MEESPATGLLIGVENHVGYEAVRLELQPGEMLLLYTDGLTAARAPAHMLTEAELASLLSQGRGREPEELAAYLEAAATGGLSRATTLPCS